MAHAIKPIIAAASGQTPTDVRGLYPGIRQVRRRQHLRQAVNALGRKHGAAERRMPMSGDASRFHDRASMLLIAEVRLARAPACKAVVRNISAAGLMVEMDEAPFRGDFVSLNLGGLGWTDGTVVWRVGRRFGVRFDREIDPANIRRPIGPLPRTYEPTSLRRLV